MVGMWVVVVLLGMGTSSPSAIKCYDNIRNITDEPKQIGKMCCTWDLCNDPACDGVCTTTTTLAPSTTTTTTTTTPPSVPDIAVPVDPIAVTTTSTIPVSPSSPSLQSSTDPLDSSTTSTGPLGSSAAAHTATTALVHSLLTMSIYGRLPDLLRRGHRRLRLS